MNTSDEDLWTALVQQNLNVRTQISAAGGVGYAGENPANPGVTFASLAEVTSIESSVVVFFGSRNDKRNDYLTIRAAAEAAYAIAMERAPCAAILVIGPPWVNAFPPKGVYTARDAVRDAAINAGATFVDPIAERWFADKEGLIGSDTAHPTDSGHAYLARLIGPHLAAALGEGSEHEKKADCIASS